MLGKNKSLKEYWKTYMRTHTHNAHILMSSSISESKEHLVNWGTYIIILRMWGS